jgi:hypothetical protein
LVLRANGSSGSVAGTDIVSVSVNTATGTVGTFIYVVLDPIILLSSGLTYVIATQEGGDDYYDRQTITTTSDVGPPTACYFGGGLWNDLSIGGDAYGPPGFSYSLTAPAPPSTGIDTILSTARINSFGITVGGPTVFNHKNIGDTLNEAIKNTRANRDYSTEEILKSGGY